MKIEPYVYRKETEILVSLSVVMPIGIYSSAQTGMVEAQRTFANAAESIASGIKSYINPADLYVATGLDTTMRSAHKAMENAQSGLNFTAVADSALSNVTQNLQRIRELSIQASNGVYSDSQRAAMQAEIDQNVEQIRQTFAQATFNGKPTINAVTPDNPNPAPVVDFMVDPSNSSSISYDPNVALDAMNFDVSTVDGAQAALAQVDTMLGDITSKRGDIGAVQSAFEGAIDQQMTNMMSSAAALSDIQDTDYISAIADLKKAQYSMEIMAKVMKTVMNSERYVLDLLQ